MTWAELTSKVLSRVTLDNDGTARSAEVHEVFSKPRHTDGGCFILVL